MFLTLRSKTEIGLWFRTVPRRLKCLGSVYNANAFIWKSDKRMGDYLHDAGGPNRDADKKHIFVLRADGAVVSNASMGGFWGGGLDSYRLEPGDAVIVPENLEKTSTLKGLRDWTQVFSQLASERGGNQCFEIARELTAWDAEFRSNSRGATGINDRGQIVAYGGVGHDLSHDHVIQLDHEGPSPSVTPTGIGSQR